MAINILGLAMDVLKALPTLVQDGSEAAALIHTTVSTIEAAQAQGRDPTQAEWDAVHSEIDRLGGELRAPEDNLNSPFVTPAGSADGATNGGDGTGTPPGGPSSDTPSASGPDTGVAAGVGPDTGVAAGVGPVTPAPDSSIMDTIRADEDAFDRKFRNDSAA